LFFFLKDFELHKGRSEYEHVLQATNKPSTETARGHQAPAAYLIMASGLDKVCKNNVLVNFVYFNVRFISMVLALSNLYHMRIVI
jgi:hypothetical protein